MSGLADPEVRFGGGIGKVLRMLIRHPNAIILVSNLDRIGRRIDTFELIQKQGLGHRIMDAETGKSLDDLMASNQHTEIARRTRDQKRAQRAGQERYLESGGVHGLPTIKKYSRRGTVKKKALAKERLHQVLRVISIMARRNYGRRPRLAEIADELNRRDIRTGQGRFFDAERLSQLRKSHPGAFKAAFATPSRDRQRIRAHVRTTSIVCAKRRQNQRRMRSLAPQPRAWTFRTTVEQRPAFDTPTPTFTINRLLIGCRSPPPSLERSVTGRR